GRAAMTVCGGCGGRRDKSITRCSASPRKIHVRLGAASGAALRPVSISEGHSVFTNPMSWLRMIAVVLLVVGIPAAEAAPLVPSSDLPGRERYRFTPSPLDRFMQPNPPARLKATEPAGEAALAVGLRSARRMVGKGAIAANATLLRGDACGVLAADGPGRILFECRPRLSLDGRRMHRELPRANLGRVL